MLSDKTIGSWELGREVFQKYWTDKGNHLERPENYYQIITDRELLSECVTELDSIGEAFEEAARRLGGEWVEKTKEVLESKKDAYYGDIDFDEWCERVDEILIAFAKKAGAYKQ